MPETTTVAPTQRPSKAAGPTVKEARVAPNPSASMSATKGSRWQSRSRVKDRHGGGEAPARRRANTATHRILQIAGALEVRRGARPLWKIAIPEGAQAAWHQPRLTPRSEWRRDPINQATQRRTAHSGQRREVAAQGPEVKERAGLVELTSAHYCVRPGRAPQGGTLVETSYGRGKAPGTPGHCAPG